MNVESEAYAQYKIHAWCKPGLSIALFTTIWQNYYHRSWSIGVNVTGCSMTEREPKGQGEVNIFIFVYVCEFIDYASIDIKNTHIPAALLKMLHQQWHHGIICEEETKQRVHQPSQHRELTRHSPSSTVRATNIRASPWPANQQEQQTQSSLRSGKKACRLREGRGEPCAARCGAGVRGR